MGLEDHLMLRTIASILILAFAAFLLLQLGSMGPSARSRKLWVDEDGNAGIASESCDGTDPVYLSIQAAIDAAEDGDEIMVCPGIYIEQITIRRNRLTIRSIDRSAVDPSADTILRPEELAPAGVWIVGDDNTLEGFVIEDKALTPPPHHHPHSLILVQGDRNTIRANRLIGRGNAGQVDSGILVHGGDVGNGVAEHNQIMENEILNVSGHGIWILSVGLNRAAYWTVVARNQVHDNPGRGITVERSPYTQVEYNMLARNDLALSLHSDASLPAAGNSFRCNQIFGNAWGARNTSADGTVMDLRFNWWGNPAGPAHEIRNLSGAGDRVGDNIDFAPWLTDPPGPVCPLIRIRIDIQPGETPNSIRSGRRVVLPVAILSGPNFMPAVEIDRNSLTFGPSGGEAPVVSCQSTVGDLDGDGVADLLCDFHGEHTGFRPEHQEGILRGRTIHGVPVEGRDAVQVSP